MAMCIRTIVISKHRRNFPGFCLLKKIVSAIIRLICSFANDFKVNISLILSDYNF